MTVLEPGLAEMRELVDGDLPRQTCGEELLAGKAARSNHNPLTSPLSHHRRVLPHRAMAPPGPHMHTFCIAIPGPAG